MQFLYANIIFIILHYKGFFSNQYYRHNRNGMPIHFLIIFFISGYGDEHKGKGNTSSEKIKMKNRSIPLDKLVCYYKNNNDCYLRLKFVGVYLFPSQTDFIQTNRIILRKMSRNLQFSLKSAL